MNDAPRKKAQHVPNPAPPPPAPATLAGRAYQRLVRQVKRARKNGQRGVKLAQYVLKRAKSARKSLFFRLRDSDKGRAFLKAATLVREPRAIRHRAQVAAPYIASLDRLPVPVIDPRTGYGLITPGVLGAFGPVLEACRRIFEVKKAALDERLSGFDEWTPEQQQKFLSGKRSFLRYLLDDDDLRRNPDIVEFALNENLLGSATRYFGFVPHLTRIDMMYSLPRGAADVIESQLFHLDHEGVTQIKHFIHLFDVGDAEGPFTFIPADATTRILGEVRKLRRSRGSGQEVELRRYSDEEIDAVGARDEIVAVKGPVGTGVAVDTSRCLHLGSRVDPGAFRLCLYLQYCMTHEITNVFDAHRFRDDPVRYLAVKDSIEPGRTRAIDYANEMMRS